MLFKNYPAVPEIVRHSSIVVMRMGSVVYGASSEDSDHDLYSVVIPTPAMLVPSQDGWLGFGKRPDTFESWQRTDLKSDVAGEPSYDMSAWNIVKYFTLAYDANPNMLDSLFVPPEHWMWKHASWDRVYNMRREFLSRKVFARYMGYAKSNREKLQKLNVGTKRSDSIEKHGYDLKAAYHLFRLVDEALEIARTGDLTLETANRSFVMKKIRNGWYKFEDFLEIMDDIERQFKVAEAESSLPEAPDFLKLNNLLWETLDEVFGGPGWSRR